MEIQFAKSFFKAYDKLQSEIKEKSKERFELFKNSPFDYLLNNHQLRGKYSGYRSINITGDYRAVYKEYSKEIARFTDIGTHA